MLSQQVGAPTLLYGGSRNDVFQVFVTVSSSYSNVRPFGDADNNVLAVYDQTGGALVQRQLSSPTTGVIKMSYPSGGTASFIYFTDVGATGSNDPVQDV